MLKQITSWRYPVSSTILNIEKDANFYKNYVLKIKPIVNQKTFYNLEYRWLDFNTIKQTPSNKKIHQLNILYNFIKLINLLNPDSTIIFNKKGVPMLYDKNQTNISIILMVNHSGYYIKIILHCQMIKVPPNYITYTYWDFNYTEQIVQCLLNCYTYEQFMNAVKLTRLIPDVLKIVYDYATLY